MAKIILVKPVISEKASKITAKRNQYTFVVNKDANKIEIKDAVAKKYNVSVLSVSTMIMPAKAKNRNTKTAVLRGRKSSFKKAVVTLPLTDTIELMAASEEGAE